MRILHLLEKLRHKAADWRLKIAGKRHQAKLRFIDRLPIAADAKEAARHLEAQRYEKTVHRWLEET